MGALGWHRPCVTVATVVFLGLFGRKFLGFAFLILLHFLFLFVLFFFLFLLVFLLFLWFVLLGLREGCKLLVHGFELWNIQARHMPITLVLARTPKHQGPGTKEGAGIAP